MAEFLSDAWLADLDAAARVADGLTCDPPFVVETVVHTTAGDTGYQVHIGPDGASITRPDHAPPDVVLVTDHDTAWALHQGTQRAQDAFARGALKVRGHPELLTGRTDVLAALARACVPLRARTTPAADR